MSNPRLTPARLARGLILLLWVGLAGLALYWSATFPDVAQLAKSNPRTTALIQARTAATARPPRWTWVPLPRISPYLRQAVVLAEDDSFYEHGGFDWKGIREAAARNVEAGKLQRGGSTITQQLAKNLYLSPEKTLLRKVREALLTWSLEQHLGKQRILELYLNVVEWGDGVYGAEAAARHHFGKAAQDLSREEAALLAAILPSPRRYDPIRLTPYLAERQRQILARMEKAPQLSRRRDPPAR
ncbi:MAG: monofunctional biosynthetic peptidoglycan transglycosylase [Nitrospirota bacterium]